MSKRLDVLLALKALLTAAVPLTTVEGLDGNDAAPDRIPADGRIVIEAGDPGEPEIDLSPLTYNYAHAVPVTIEVGPGDGLTGEQRADAMLGAIADAIEADRFLGGLVDWLDAAAPATDDDQVEGAAVTRVAPITIVASYSTTRPL